MTATIASVEAQAKLNLWLRVLAREASGYHQLESLFVRIDLADTVRVATDTSVREVECPGLELPTDRNLAYRAATAFADAAGWPHGFHIHIEKRIPAGGGLGGGSADAGAVLRILNALAPRPLARDVLMTLALRLGADVPVMTLDAALALGWGRGERLLALPPLPAREILLALPPFGVETAAAFRWYAEALPSDHSLHAPAPLSRDDLDRWDHVIPRATNDLEGVVGGRHPEIAACVNRMRVDGARIAMMSGSGSTVFGLFDRRAPHDAAEFPAGTRLVQTRTSTRVAPVRVLD